VKPWNLLAEGPFGREDLHVDFRDEMMALPPVLEAEISTHWEQAVGRARKRGVRLFDGGLFQLEDLREEAGRLHLVLARSSYRRWTFAAGRKDAAWISRPLACCAALLSADGKLLLQERSAEVAEGAGLLHVPGGHPDPRRDLLGGQPDLFGAMEAELREELAIAPDDLHDGRILALVENAENGKPELLFFYRTPLDATALAEKAHEGVDRYEYDSLRFIAAEPESIAEFLAKNGKRLAVPSRALLEILGSDL